MKKIIKGKMYNTDTAKEIVTHFLMSNANLEKTITLYQKRTGEFFMHHVPQRGTQSIKLCTDDYAREFASQHMSADEYEELFGKAEE